ncbi:Uncharacterized protein FWK35_00005307 [Aphis craccivora]|uniref:Uncharacterized protein n=1 Tax=Aphis craccivora TaxID=307492 RepID=A0A6G0Z0N6_APHCR|nr:Uncharacterized protein FWK35_00005307 [Aphis craccivora]
MFFPQQLIKKCLPLPRKISGDAHAIVNTFIVVMYEHHERTILNEVKNVLILRVFFFFVFVSVYSITSRNNAPISNYGGGFRCKSEYP